MTFYWTSFLLLHTRTQQCNWNVTSLMSAIYILQGQYLALSNSHLELQFFDWACVSALSLGGGVMFNHSWHHKWCKYPEEYNFWYGFLFGMFWKQSNFHLIFFFFKCLKFYQDVLNTPFISKHSIYSPPTQNWSLMFDWLLLPLQ